MILKGNHSYTYFPMLVDENFMAKAGILYMKDSK